MSKAALWSNKVRIETNWLSALQRGLPVTLSKNVSVLILPTCWLTNFAVVVFGQVGFKLCQDNFFKYFERNGRLETGLNFFKSFTSRPGFLRRGLTVAVLKMSEIMPVVREVFMILVMTGTKMYRHYSVRGVGIKSRLVFLRWFS